MFLPEHGDNSIRYTEYGKKWIAKNILSKGFGKCRAYPFNITVTTHSGKLKFFATDKKNDRKIFQFGEVEKFEDRNINIEFPPKAGLIFNFETTLE